MICIDRVSTQSILSRRRSGGAYFGKLPTWKSLIYFRGSFWGCSQLITLLLHANHSNRSKGHYLYCTLEVTKKSSPLWRQIDTWVSARIIWFSKLRLTSRSSNGDFARLTEIPATRHCHYIIVLKVHQQIWRQRNGVQFSCRRLSSAKLTQKLTVGHCVITATGCIFLQKSQCRCIGGSDFAFHRVRSDGEIWRQNTFWRETHVSAGEHLTVRSCIAALARYRQWLCL